jgi:predicted transposase YbfD/YdcC
MEMVLAILREVRDPRDATAQHDLAELLFIALVASLCGAQNGSEMAAFGRAKEALLRQVLVLKHGVPSHDTFSRVFRLIDAQVLAGLLQRFAEAFGQAARGVVAVDGKSLRRAYAAGLAHMPPMSVSVWAAETRLTLAQVMAPGGNEAEAAIAALKLIDLKGCIVTADALHCHRSMASVVSQAKGDYVLALKANQSKLYAQAKAACQAAVERPRQCAETLEMSHGRSDRRSAIVVPFAQSGKRNRFAKLAAVACIASQRSQAGTSETSERYYLLSRRFKPAELLTITRQHWDIENGLHWRLDVVFDEDHARSRKDNAPANFAVLRRLAMNILQSHPAKTSLNLKRRTAGWNDSFLLELFTHMQ